MGPTVSMVTTADQNRRMASLRIAPKKVLEAAAAGRLFFVA